MAAKFLFITATALLLIAGRAAYADAGSQCTICTYVLKNSQTRLASIRNISTAEDGAVIQVLKDTCSKMDGTPGAMCAEIVGADGKSFARSIRKGEAPQQACQRAGMCLAGH